MYKDIEGTHSNVVKAVICNGGLESVVKSMVNNMEEHSEVLRVIMDQEILKYEAMEAWNSEHVFHCDQIVKEALMSY